MHKRFWLAPLAVAASLAAPSFAQTETPPQPQAAPSPAPERPKPCTGPEHRQFDFWVGDWNVHGPKGRLAGTNRIESILGGCVVQENWQGNGGLEGTSLNIYDPSDKKWHQTWVDGQGNLLLLSGALKDGKMDMTGETLQDGKKVLQRVVWEPLSGGKVRQHWTSSSDGGTTWNTVFDGTYSRKQ